MKLKKGCVNSSCIDCTNKKRYEQDKEVCDQCGDKLQYVCSKCYTELPDDSSKLCIACAAERADKLHKAKAVGGAIAGIVLAVVILLFKTKDGKDNI